MKLNYYVENNIIETTTPKPPAIWDKTLFTIFTNKYDKMLISEIILDRDTLKGIHKTIYNLCKDYDIENTDIIFSYDGFYSIPGMVKVCKYKIARISEILANDLYVWGFKKSPLKTYEGEFKGIGYYPALPEIILKKDQLDYISNYKKVNHDLVELKRL